MLKLSKRILCLTAAFLTIGLSSALAGEPEPLLPDWNKFEHGNHTLGFHGYFRTSAGWDDEGGKVMPVFRAPGAQSRYRLGNESDTNIEVALDYKYHLDGVNAENGRFIQLYGMLDDYENNPNYGNVELELERDRNPQSFIKLGNFFDNGADVWFGRRYYDRRDIHMIDHFWLNVAQGAEFGGGIEEIPLGNQTLDIAAFKSEDNYVSDRLGVNSNRENVSNYSLDLRYRGLKTNDDGELTLWGLYSHRPEVDEINYDNENGFALGGWHTQQNIWDGRMVTGFAYRHGTALQQGLWNSRSVREDQGYDLNDAYSIEVNNDLLIEPSDDFAMQWVAVLRREDRGTGAAGGDTIDWASTGVRPVFFLNNYVSVATEFGVDYVNDKTTDLEGTLGKGTVALQLTRGRGYFRRPMIKLFATGATWTDDFKGQVGSNTPREANSFADDTSGMFYGIQFETWW